LDDYEIIYLLSVRHDSMAQETPNHKYNRPKKGEEDWHNPLNENFNDIDADVELRDFGGPNEGSNDYEPVENAKYFDMESGRVYIGFPATTGFEWAPAFMVTAHGNEGSQPLLLGPTAAVTNNQGIEYTFSGNAITGQLTEVTAGARGVVISGGGGRNETDNTELQNTVTDHHGTIGGGLENQAGDDDNDPLSASSATVCGGFRNTASGLRSTVGGGFGNTASGDNATVGGGDENTGTDDHATVGGGEENTASNLYSTVGGGNCNTASGYRATIGGGFENTASGDNATIGGGFVNTASAFDSTVGGGDENTASGIGATVPGGEDNVASGAYSLAGGRKAKTDGNDGAFVWGDSSDQQVKAGSADEFKLQAGGGAVIYSQSNLNTGVLLPSGGGSWSAVSTQAVKTNIDPVDPAETLAKVDQLEISRWEYDSEEDAEHIGPMAEEFYDAFGLGVDEKHITGIDSDGVALAAIQGLSAKLDDAHEEIAHKDERIEKQTDRIGRLEAENEQLRERLAAVEDHLGLRDSETTTQSVTDE
jgi:hypothetical protein